MRYALSAVVPAIALLAQVAAAAQLTLVYDDRVIWVSEPWTSVYASPPFSPFDQSVGGPEVNASQNTTVTESEMGGTLSTSALPLLENDSTFSVVFIADEDVTYELSGSALGNNSVLVSLFKMIVYEDVFLAESFGPFSSSGTLTAGNQYGLIVSVGTYGTVEYSTSASLDFQFSVTPVPEPSTAGLLGVGLLGLALRRSATRS